MTSLKMDGFMRPFRGRGDDWDMFWTKYGVLASASGWNTTAKKMDRLPLFLEGEAFLVFSKMSELDKRDADRVTFVMRKSFSVTASEAYRMFTHRKLLMDESPDAYVADLQRLLELSGHFKTDGDCDAVLIEQMLVGLPHEFEKDIRLSFAGSELSVADCVERIRALKAVRSSMSSALSIAGAAPARGASSTGPSRSFSGAQSVLCYFCNEVGHIRRFCAKKQQVAGKVVTCYFCEKPGHQKKDCHARKKWLASQDKGAAAVESGTNECLCIVSTQGRLPRVHLEVRLRESDAKMERVRSVVDTGSTRTLVSQALVDKLGVAQNSMKKPSSGIVALDGKPLNVVGSILLSFKRNDGPVRLPPVTLGVLVVPDLSVVSSDLLVGSDLIAKSGGLCMAYNDDGSLASVEFGGNPTKSVNVAASSVDYHKLPRGVSIDERDNSDVVLSTDDGVVTWIAAEKRWQMSWKWKDGQEPTNKIGHGIGEYSRAKLTPDQEEKFCAEVDSWVKNGWLVEHNPAIHGDPAAVLPFIAVAQEHKATTPVRPCLDYRFLNDHLVSKPGMESPVCGETIRKWRATDEPEKFVMLDIRKAYLQVHVSPELLRYQTVVWRGKLFVMTRMAFGMSVAPKMMDVIVKYVTQEHNDVDNYVDDLVVPKAKKEVVIQQLGDYGLPTKPCEPMQAATVLGLKLAESPDGVQWSRRNIDELGVPERLTKRKLFSWCGKLTSHYPVCAWLRPRCS